MFIQKESLLAEFERILVKFQAETRLISLTGTLQQVVTNIFDADVDGATSQDALSKFQQAWEHFSTNSVNYQHPCWPLFVQTCCDLIEATAATTQSRKDNHSGLLDEMLWAILGGLYLHLEMLPAPVAQRLNMISLWLQNKPLLSINQDISTFEVYIKGSYGKYIYDYLVTKAKIALGDISLYLVLQDCEKILTSIETDIDVLFHITPKLPDTQAGPIYIKLQMELPTSIEAHWQCDRRLRVLSKLNPPLQHVMIPVKKAGVDITVHPLSERRMTVSNMQFTIEFNTQTCALKRLCFPAWPTMVPQQEVRQAFAKKELITPLLWDVMEEIERTNQYAEKNISTLISAIKNIEKALDKNWNLSLRNKNVLEKLFLFDDRKLIERISKEIAKKPYTELSSEQWRAKFEEKITGKPINISSDTPEEEMIAHAVTLEGTGTGTGTDAHLENIAEENIDTDSDKANVDNNITQIVTIINNIASENIFNLLEVEIETSLDAQDDTETEAQSSSNHQTIVNHGIAKTKENASNKRNKQHKVVGEKIKSKTEEKEITSVVVAMPTLPLTTASAPAPAANRVDVTQPEETWSREELTCLQWFCKQHINLGFASAAFPFAMLASAIGVVLKLNRTETMTLFLAMFVASTYFAVNFYKENSLNYDHRVEKLKKSLLSFQTLYNDSYRKKTVNEIRDIIAKPLKSVLLCAYDAAYHGELLNFTKKDLFANRFGATFSGIRYVHELMLKECGENSKQCFAFVTDFVERYCAKITSENYKKLLENLRNKNSDYLLVVTCLETMLQQMTIDSQKLSEEDYKKWLFIAEEICVSSNGKVKEIYCESGNALFKMLAQKFNNTWRSIPEPQAREARLIYLKNIATELAQNIVEAKPQGLKSWYFSAKDCYYTTFAKDFENFRLTFISALSGEGEAVTRPFTDMLEDNLNGVEVVKALSRVMQTGIMLYKKLGAADRKLWVDLFATDKVALKFHFNGLRDWIEQFSSMKDLALLNTYLTPCGMKYFFQHHIKYEKIPSCKMFLLKGFNFHLVSNDFVEITELIDNTEGNIADIEKFKKSLFEAAKKLLNMYKDEFSLPFDAGSYMVKVTVDNKKIATYSFFELRTRIHECYNAKDGYEERLTLLKTQIDCCEFNNTALVFNASKFKAKLKI